MTKTVALHTLGCKLNFSETSSISRLLEQDGFEKREFNDIADVYVINTCSVTENADKECRQLVRRIQRKAPSSMVVITGCYAQLKPTEIAAIEGVDLVLGAAEKFDIVNHLRELTKGSTAKICSCDIEDVNIFIPSHSINDRTRTFLKVQDGCDYNCSFCTIPMARGKSRSDSIQNIIAKVRQLASDGVQEIVLTGINLGDFGLQHTNEYPHENKIAIKGREQDFFMLMQALEKEEGIPRYRISSIEPNLLSHEMIDFVAQSIRFMPHFHIPLQSGSNKILRTMRRRYNKEMYKDKIEHIKKAMPHAAIGVDVIVGFPGESEADFNETVTFIESLDVSYLHVFTYSERLETHAVDIKPIVPIQIRNERNKILRKLSYQKLRDFTEQHRFQIRKVLFERNSKNGVLEGYSDNYIKVSAAYNDLLVNKIVDWQL